MTRKFSLFALALALIFVLGCASGPSGKEFPKPEAIPFDGTTQVVDLTTGWAPIKAFFTFAPDYSYVNAKNLEFFQFPLAQELEAGDSIDVTIKGKNNGTLGFRVWLTDYHQTTLSNHFLDSVGPGLPSGDFELNFTLTAEGDVENLFIKGSAYGTNIDNVDISSIVIVYN